MEGLGTWRNLETTQHIFRYQKCCSFKTQDWNLISLPTWLTAVEMWTFLTLATHSDGVKRDKPPPTHLTQWQWEWHRLQHTPWKPNLDIKHTHMTFQWNNYWWSKQGCPKLVLDKSVYTSKFIFFYTAQWDSFTCRRSMKASWSVSPWKPGTGSELANTGKKRKHAIALKWQNMVHMASVTNCGSGSTS